MEKQLRQFAFVKDSLQFAEPEERDEHHEQERGQSQNWSSAKTWYARPRPRRQLYWQLRTDSLKIVVDEESPEIIRVEPVVQVNLIKIRGYQFLSQFMGLAAQERHLQSGQYGDQRLRYSVRTHAMRVR